MVQCGIEPQPQTSHDGLAGIRTCGHYMLRTIFSHSKQFSYDWGEPERDPPSELYAGGGVGMYACMYVIVRSTVKFLLSDHYKFARYENGCCSRVV